LPLPRLTDYGLDILTDAVDGAETEERASCLFARRVLEEKRRASVCFAHIAYPNPPPPPVRVAHDSTSEASLRRIRSRLNDLEKYEAPRKTDRAQWEEDTRDALKGTQALLDKLGEGNPILQGLLENAKLEILDSQNTNLNTAYVPPESSPDGTVAADATSSTSIGYGRRLMQRKEYNVRMTDELIKAEIMTFYGTGGIPGVTSASCEALCEATAQLQQAPPDEICRAFAFKRAFPFSYVDRTGWCYLLKVRPRLAYRHRHRHRAIAPLTPTLACPERGRVQDRGLWCRCAPCVPTRLRTPIQLRHPLTVRLRLAELYTRQIESERQCSATAPGLDSAPAP